MKDSEFKKFQHNVPNASRINSKGTNISSVGNYRPDISIKNNDDRVFLVLESEHKSDRKAFIGALVHAFKYADEQKSRLCLVFVMKETGNQTTVDQVSNNIRPYYIWLNPIANVTLTAVYIISDVEYIASAHANETLLASEFISRCIAL